MNSQEKNAKRNLKSSVGGPTRWWAAPAAFLATILALPVNAGISLPDDPLTTGNRVAPNVLFILDDSGSMVWRYMYALGVNEITGPNGFRSVQTADNLASGGDADYTTTSTSPVGIYDQNYRTNTLYYNPTINYEPWVQANGNDMTGGTSYASAYSNSNLASGPIDLGDDLQVFYTPKDPGNASAAYVGNVENYYRYHIQPTSAGGGIVRGAWGNVVETIAAAAGFPKTGLNADSGWGTDYTFNVPSGAAAIEVTVAGGTHGTNTAANNNGGNGADLYVRRAGAPSAGTPYDCTSLGGGNDESCMITYPASGTWHVQLNTASRYRNVTLSVRVVTATNRCEYPGTRTATDFVSCTVAALPSTLRTTVDAEKANFATWYSYHRTRIKAAKAGAGRAFRNQGNNIRVGYRTIHNRSNFDIPVASGDGRFIDDTVVKPAVSNRTTWYSRLYAAAGSSGTPLQAALDSAGAYFSRTTADGPYGPLAGVNQYSCRQNFTILTTDGYWNTSLVDVGNSDGTNGTQITNDKPSTDPNYKSFTYTAASPYSDSRKETLADVAMHYWKRDLRGDLANNVPSSTDNPAFWQHMVTFGISIGVSGTTGWKNVDEVPASANWPDPTDSEDTDRIDDLLHAAVNGRGKFVSAMDPGAFTAGLSEALAVIEQRTSSYSNVSTNSTSLNTGAQVFSASYTSGLWAGELRAQSVTRSGVAGAVTWTASLPSFADRRVFTHNGLVGTGFPTAAQTLALARPGGPVDYPVTGSKNADYIKGDQSGEGTALGKLRVRTKLLGDIVGSSPVFVKGGAGGDGTAAGTVYVGANDGMLHAFDAGSGKELFAYVPNIINFNNLATLSRGDYTHKFFVDGPIAVSSRLMTPGKNLLVGALGRGGKGLYALDVSSPTAFAATNVKWERSDTDGKNMGLVLGAPILANVRNGVPVNAAVLGNGPNSTTERAVLLVINLETGAVIREIDTGVGSAALPNGLSTPTGVYAADGKTLVYVYAGDLQGNVWKFDLRSASPAAWTATRIFSAAKGVAQPITGGLAVATDPATNKRWVFFGTGRFLTTGDVDDRSTNAQSIYGVKDEDAPYSRSDLTQRTITVTATQPNGYPVRAFEAKSALPATSKGWYVDLPGAGERIVQDTQIASNFVVTASMIPEGDACEGSGTGYINALDAFTGTSGGTSFFDLNNDGKTDDSGVPGGLPIGSANMGVGMPTRPVLLPGQFVLGGSGNGTEAGLGGGRSFGMQWQRVSWREIRQD